MKTSPILLALLCLALPLLPAPAEEAKLPGVDLTFGGRDLGEWQGKTVAEIIPPATISRVVLLEQTVWMLDRVGQARMQAGYDACLAQLFASPRKAQGYGLGGNEGTLSELIVLTKDGQLFQVEIVGTLGQPHGVPTAALLRGEKWGARFELKFVDPKS